MKRLLVILVILAAVSGVAYLSKRGNAGERSCEEKLLATSKILLVELGRIDQARNEERFYCGRLEGKSGNNPIKIGISGEDPIIFSLPEPTNVLLKPCDKNTRLEEITDEYMKDLEKVLPKESASRRINEETGINEETMALLSR